MIQNYGTNGWIFDAGFDSGNLAKVEVAKVFSEGVEKTAPHNETDIEFNLWTKPDCAGTPYENSNRTWFFFSITGGRPYQVAKINIMNLNKQAKLFSQGMHPVVRIGQTGKWERIKEKPAYFMTADSFILTFLHKNHENPAEVKTFYAFTFPYTYTEQQDQLDIYDEKFGKDEIGMDLFIQELKSQQMKPRQSSTKSGSNSPPLDLPKQLPEVIVEERLISANDPKSNTILSVYSNDTQITRGTITSTNSLEYLKHNFEIKTTDELLQQQYRPSPPPKQNSTTVPSAHMVIDENTSESMQQITDLVHNVKIELQQKEDEKPTDLRDDIYYHRELLIRSYEGRRIDLVTISSFHGITDQREERIKTLFPDLVTPRCHVFKDKKIIFISSRVHPGETPASFVLNGFLQLILDRKNVIAQTLRRMYVFKIVPFLNPDGVYNGLYRSDMLGFNLNRVYLNPNPETQPSIYAVRRLIRFHHFGFDKPDVPDSNSPKLQSPPPRNGAGNSLEVPIIDGNTTAYSGGDTCETHRDEDLSLPITSSGIASYEIEDCDENATDMGLFAEVHSSRESSTSSTEEPKANTFIIPPKTGVDPELDNKTTTIASPPKSAPNQKPPLTKLPRPNTSGSSSRKSVDRVTLKNTINKSSSISTSTPARVGSGAVTLKKPLPTKGAKPAALGNSNIQPSQLTSHFRSHRNELPQFSPKNLNISLDFLTETDDKGEKSIAEDTSGMFLYLDLHGHASKKGIFMYGNHLPTTQEAVECMLLPRLMSMNCQHFHFDACNFSEKNMYLKGKRDGLSKEGSGRVAIFKMIGLIKSYTLESNYNTGKYVNLLPPKGKDTVMNKAVSIVPPKYTPTIFEEVGRGLGPSILDLSSSNPCSRLVNSDFRTLQGLRLSLKSEIERGTKGRPTSKVLKPNKSKRGAGNAPQTDVSKENKGFNNYQSENAVPGPSTKSIKNGGSNNSSSSNGNSNNGNNDAKVSANTKLQAAAKLTRKNLAKFVKKDSTITVSLKKTKVLGESSTSALKVDSNRNNKDSNIPRKKIKVSPQHHRGVETTEPLITCFGETFCRNTSAVDSFDMCFTSNITTSTFSSSSLPNFFTQTPNLVDATNYQAAAKKVKAQCLTSANTLDLDDSLDAVPCCSYSLPSTSEPSLATFHGKLSAARSKEFKSKFSKATSSKQQSKITKAGSDGGKSKLKKKRTLRSDSSLKRKKTRVKPVVC